MRNTMKTILCLLFFISLFFATFKYAEAQVEQPQKENSFIDRFYIGGNLGAQFGTITSVDVSPLIGIKIYKGLTGGIGFTYQYFSDKNYDPKFQTSLYGGRLFLRYYLPILNEGIFLHAEYEMLNYENIIIDNNSGRVVDQFRDWMSSYLVGAGYRQNIGGKVFIDFAILWNLNDKPDSPYRNPIIRIGINFGL